MYFNTYIIISCIIKQATNQNNVPSSIIIIKLIVFFFTANLLSNCVVVCCLIQLFLNRIIRTLTKMKAVFFIHNYSFYNVICLVFQ